MIISINQPAYLPWLGYFERIYNSDIHIVLDHVQFEKNSMINRNKIKTAQGWCWLTIPLNTSKKFGNLALNQITVNNTEKWQKKHWNSIFFNYKKTPYFYNYSDQLEVFYNTKWEKLEDILRWQLNFFLSALSLKTKIVYSSEQAYQSKKSNLVLDICLKNQATCYLSGPFGKNYLNEEDFINAGISLKYQQYEHPQYKQLTGTFQSHLSTLDLLCNHGSKSIKILTHNTDNK